MKAVVKAVMSLKFDMSPYSFKVAVPTEKYVRLL